ncbi:MAG: TRAP transporter large permease subunit, partial [Sphaerochaetaceae bacterium]|nr:TRAP transporter large permease subunit [Sphaerochaetaceae bacterium]
PIIPPSTGMIFLAIYFEVSVRRLFIGGIIPGLLLGLFQVVVSIVISKKRNFPCEPFKGWKNVANCAVDGLFALLLPVGVMICLLLGIGTVVEIAATSVVLAILVAILYKEFNLKVFIKSLSDVGLQMGAILLMMGSSGVFKWIIDRVGVGKYLVSVLTIFGTNPFVIVGFTCVIYLLLGCIFDSSILQFVITPMLVPTFLALDIDLIWLCVLLVLCIQLGQNTPPVGCLIYITSSIAGCNAAETIKESIPYLIGDFILVALLVAFPFLVTWLPSLVI